MSINIVRLISNISFLSNLRGSIQSVDLPREEYVRQMCREQVGTNNHVTRLPLPWRAEKAGRSWIIVC
jgi:hypothetical protein